MQSTAPSMHNYLLTRYITKTHIWPILTTFTPPPTTERSRDPEPFQPRLLPLTAAHLQTAADNQLNALNVLEPRLTLRHLLTVAFPSPPTHPGHSITLTTIKYDQRKSPSSIHGTYSHHSLLTGSHHCPLCKKGSTNHPVNLYINRVLRSVTLFCPIS